MTNNRIYSVLLAMLALMPVLAFSAPIDPCAANETRANTGVVTDPNAKGKYHWYTNRRTSHTDVRQSENAGRHALPQAVTGDQ